MDFINSWLANMTLLVVFRVPQYKWVDLVRYQTLLGTYQNSGVANVAEYHQNDHQWPCFAKS